MKKIHRRQTGFLFVLPSLLGVLVFIVVPFGDVARRSFTEAVSGAWVGFANYRMVFSNTAFRLAAGNTLRFEGICIPLLLAFFVAQKQFMSSFVSAGIKE